MGLSSKQVSNDGLGWKQSLLQAQTLELPKASATKRQNPQNQQDQQQSEPPLKCPRCDSANTKFCYYNNYNKSQPRHFCKNCKRHWTKGGTLRNVPVGGGRKNKRLKTSNSNTTDSPAVTASASASPSTAGAMKSSSGVNRPNCNTFVRSIQQQQREDLQLPLADQKNMPSMQFCQPSSLLQQNSVNCSNLDNKSFSTSEGFFLGSSSTLSLPQTQDVQFPFSSSSSSSFDTITSSTIYNYAGETVEDPTISSTTASLPWQIPIITSGMDMTNYWNWDDIDALVSTNLNMPWDVSENKP